MSLVYTKNNTTVAGVPILSERKVYSENSVWHGGAAINAALKTLGKNILTCSQNNNGIGQCGILERCILAVGCSHLLHHNFFWPNLK